ncbi:MAG: hypothetical protein ACOCWM_01015 [Cyclobacteriaceae bacterium]
MASFDMQLKSVDLDEQQDIEYHELEYDYKVTDKDRAEFAESQNQLIDKNKKLESKIDGLRNEQKTLKAQMDENFDELKRLNYDYRSETVKRTVEAKVVYEWKTNTRIWRHPDTNEVLKTDFIPPEKKQTQIID